MKGVLCVLRFNKMNFKIEMLSKAIKERRLVKFVYEGEIRIVEPFTLGVIRKSNKLSISAYIIDGFSKSKNPSPWRLYHLNKITQLEILEFEAECYREGYKESDSRMSEIICEVKSRIAS